MLSLEFSFLLGLFNFCVLHWCAYSIGISGSRAFQIVLVSQREDQWWCVCNEDYTLCDKDFHYRVLRERGDLKRSSIILFSQACIISTLEQGPKTEKQCQCFFSNSVLVIRTFQLIYPQTETKFIFFLLFFNTFFSLIRFSFWKYFLSPQFICHFRILIILLTIVFILKFQLIMKTN